MELLIKDTITEKISGEWGEEAVQGEGVKVIRTANFTNLGIIDYKNLVLRQIDPRKIQQKKLKKGDIIIEKSGGSPNQPVGRVVFFDLDTDEEYLCNNFTTILRPDTTKVHPKYLFYQLFIGHVRGRTLRYQNKTTGIINLKLDNYLNEKVIVPARADQSRIATILGLAQFLVSQRKRSIDLLEDYLRSTFIEMFGNIFQNKKKWQIKRLESVSSKITDGKHGDCINEDNSGYYFISAKDLVNGTIEYKGVRQITKQDFEETHKRTQLKLNDILIGNTGASIGKIAIVVDEEKANRTTFQKSVAIVSANQSIVNPLFLKAFLEFNSKFLDNISTGSGQKNLLLSQLRSLKILIPPIELQNQFSKIVENIESLKKTYSESLNEIEMLFGSLCQKAFKGELKYKFFETDDTLEYEYSDSIGREEEYFPADDVKGTEIKKEPIKVKKKKKEAEIKAKSKITWDKVSSQQVAEWIKEKYEGYHFSNEMLIRFLMNEYVVFLDYYSSEELKKYPQLNGADDIKSFIFSAVSNENPFIKLEQHFFNAEKETFQLNVTEEDYELIESREAKERSGIYFSIIEK